MNVKGEKRTKNSLSGFEKRILFNEKFKAKMYKLIRKKVISG